MIEQWASWVMLFASGFVLGAVYGFRGSAKNYELGAQHAEAEAERQISLRVEQRLTELQQEPPNAP